MRKLCLFIAFSLFATAAVLACPRCDEPEKWRADGCSTSSCTPCGWFYYCCILTNQCQDGPFAMNEGDREIMAQAIVAGDARANVDTVLSAMESWSTFSEPEKEAMRRYFKEITAENPGHLHEKENPPVKVE